MWEINFISETDFENHVANTIAQYGSKLTSYDLNRFNLNKIDPIKLLFDKSVYRYDWDDVIKNELSRQRDKSSNNDIGYFHQRIFNYIEGCEVPNQGWDIILRRPEGYSLSNGEHVSTIYVEMKNKHNTMNSSSAQKTYIAMQNQILKDDDCACFLVEIIAKNSQNIPWSARINGLQSKHNRIRRVSIDEFYKIVTNQDDAFKQICAALPGTIDKVINSVERIDIPEDTVIDELYAFAEQRHISVELALFILGFNSYKGFD